MQDKVDNFSMYFSYTHEIQASCESAVSEDA